jgi:hypothetical protein
MVYNNNLHKTNIMFLLLDYNKIKKQRKLNICITITKRGRWTYEAFGRTHGCN